mmetsp:Transcript_5766/g.7240  ORF Transcript_5766/g.7240 Transcript_5766/m.7240 type:complete len:237 (+) Transcript_5766:54-764(+)
MSESHLTEPTAGRRTMKRKKPQDAALTIDEDYLKANYTAKKKKRRSICLLDEFDDVQSTGDGSNMESKAAINEEDDEGSHPPSLISSVFSDSSESISYFFGKNNNEEEECFDQEERDDNEDIESDDEEARDENVEDGISDKENSSSEEGPSEEEEDTLEQRNKPHRSEYKKLTLSRRLSHRISDPRLSPCLSPIEGLKLEFSPKTDSALKNKQPQKSKCSKSAGRRNGRSAARRKK